MITAGKVNAYDNVEEWNSDLKEASESKKLVVIDFTAKWCGPCHKIAPFFAELAEEYPNVVFFEIDVDKLETVAKDFNVQAMPTFVFMKEGVVVGKFVGPDKEKLSAQLVEHTAVDEA